MDQSAPIQSHAWACRSWPLPSAAALPHPCSSWPLQPLSAAVLEQPSWYLLCGGPSHQDSSALKDRQVRDPCRSSKSSRMRTQTCHHWHCSRLGRLWTHIEPNSLLPMTHIPGLLVRCGLPRRAGGSPPAPGPRPHISQPRPLQPGQVDESLCLLPQL